MKGRELLEFLFLCAGIAGVGAYEYSVVESWLYQAYDGYRLDMTGVPETTLPVSFVKPEGPVGLIEIPSVEVKSIIQEGADDTTLRRAAGHVPGTALPGQDGNVAIAAHRDTFFRGLRGIETNDLIRVRTSRGNYEYRVTSMEIVKPSDVRVLKPHGGRELTLITCYPFNFIGHAPSRYIVHASQVIQPNARPVFGPAGSGM